MTESLKEKWRMLRLYRTRSTLLVDYRILKNTEKLMGARNENRA